MAVLASKLACVDTANLRQRRLPRTCHACMTARADPAALNVKIRHIVYECTVCSHNFSALDKFTAVKEALRLLG